VSKNYRNHLHILSVRLCFTLIICILLPMGLVGDGEGASIQGSVTITNRDGSAKKDHSGVVVFLDELEKPSTQTAPGKRAVIQQIKKKFIPEILPIQVGTTVDFPNDDMVFHNVFSLSKTKNFDLGLYKQGESKSATFDKPGLVKIYCNIHPQMIAYILVLTNPHFTVTDRNGQFSLLYDNEGQVTVRTWYSKSSTFPEERVHITSAGVKDLNFGITEDIRFKIIEESISIKHTNKWGQEYPSTY